MRARRYPRRVMTRQERREASAEKRREETRRVFERRRNPRARERMHSAERDYGLEL